MTTKRIAVLGGALAALSLVVLAAAASAQQQGQERQRRGFGPGFGRSSLLGLLRIEKVQQELKLTDEQRSKVQEVGEKLMGEMRDEFAKLREAGDRSAAMAKMEQLRDQLDAKAREALRDVLQREQLMRLYQIRLQLQPVLESLANQFVARRLELTDEQKEKLAAIEKETEAKRRELFASLRGASGEQRRAAFGKMRQLQEEADAKALEVLTEQQRAAFEKMKGEKFELPERRGG